MTNIKTKRGTIAILTGGGDVPGLNPAIRAVTIRALREGFRVIGIRHGWAGTIDIIHDKKANNAENVHLTYISDPTNISHALIWDGNSYETYWQDRDVAFRLEGSVVPIPAAAWLFGSALAGLGWMRRKRTA